MQKQIMQQKEILFIGLMTRTCNRDEFQAETAKIGPLLGRYLGQNLAAQIPNRVNPGVTLAVYTEYASDEHGDYTYLIGEAVSSLKEIPEGFNAITIPAGKYVKFTTQPGAMPNVVIEAWQQIWQMTSADFGGKRLYDTDYEVYDQRAANPAQAVVDICLGID